MDTPAPKPIVCKAAVSRAAGDPLQIEEVVVCPPKAHEARIKIICTSLRHTDLTVWRMKEFPGVFPRILGHETVGVVESVGDGVEEVSVGDTVLPVFMPHCQECTNCRSPKGNFCTTLPFTAKPGMPRDGTSRFASAATGEVLHNFLNLSSFTEYTVVDVAHLVKVEPGMPPEKACLLSCGISTGVGATWKTAAVEEGSTVAIFGLGAVGLAVVQGAKIRGARKIIGVDINSAKFEIGYSGDDWSWCRLLLRVHWFGIINDYSIPKLSTRKSIEGSLFGGIKAKVDIPILMKQYLKKELLLDEFITHEVAFQDINKAFDLLIEGKSLRCTIWMDNQNQHVK